MSFDPPEAPINVNRQGGGYLARLTRSGKQYRRFFADSTFGSSQAALEAAIAWRDRKRGELPGARTHGKEVEGSRVHPQNWSGVRGLGLTSNRHGNLVVQAWTPEARRRRSIPYHGLKSALRFACEWLARQRRKDADPEKMYETALPRFRERVAAGSGGR